MNDSLYAIGEENFKQHGEDMEITIESLTKLCHPDRDDLSKPFRRNGYVYATQGKYIVRIPMSEKLTTDHESGVDISSIKFDGIENLTEWVDVPAMSYDGCYKTCGKCNGTGKVRQCPSCYGDGVVECDMGHEHDCEACHGSGISEHTGKTVECRFCIDGRKGMDKHIGIAKHFFTPYLLYDLQQVLGQLRMYNGEHCIHGQVPFTFEGGCGIIAPRRQ